MPWCFHHHVHEGVVTPWAGCADELDYHHPGLFQAGEEADVMGSGRSGILPSSVTVLNGLISQSESTGADGRADGEGEPHTFQQEA